ncbi:hypothetical protein Moror_8416 [Moniliophthora roreri MCA 2997]|uniref:Uncharacterized protein n=1 Tax=Moniliophthora roreri (strain MCA 2997) TaxID=1381753 RepID=V2WP51_MONRO|nr:hypothetical protein Moror_8416 [Moniliophthora roreri MCA 2997]
MERVDDMDPRIEYTPANSWFTAGVSEEYNSTTHCSQSSPAEMTFQFNGTSIAVYGTISPLADRPNPVDLYILDGSPPVQFAPIIQAGVVRRHERMFFSPTLKDGLHTLVMRRMVNNSESFVDYIDFTPSVASGESSSSLVLPSPSITNEPQNDGNNSVQSKSLSTGALIGIVVACVVLLLAILVLLFLFLRRQRQRAREKSSPPVFEANVPVGSLQPARPSQFQYSQRSTSQPQTIPSTSESWNNTLSVPSGQPTLREPLPGKSSRFVVNTPSESLSAGSESALSDEPPPYRQS